MWIVETKVFLKIILFFLVKENRKKSYHMILMLAKSGYHTRNECACDEMCSTINESEHIDLDRTSKEYFF